MRLCTILLMLGAQVLVSLAFPHPQGGAAPAQQSIDRDGGGYNDHYFQYINVPAEKVFEWGYRRGAPSHFREEYLSQKDHTFKAKLKWGDHYGGQGEMFYDINHGPSYDDHHSREYQAAPHKPAYAPGTPA